MAKKSNLQAQSKNFIWIGGVILILLIATGVTLFILNKSDTGIGSGEAFHAETSTGLTGTTTDAQLSFNTGYAAAGNEVSVIVKIRSSSQAVSRVSFEVESQPCLVRQGAPEALSSLNSRTDPVNPNSALASEREWSFFTTSPSSGSKTGDFDLVRIKFNVASGVTSGQTCSVSVKVNEIVNDGTKLNNDYILRNAVVTMAPVCTDVDGDGFGVVSGSTDPLILKACTYPSVVDCNDNCNTCYPSYNQFGLTKTAPVEICDNKDNDCAGGVDNAAQVTDTTILQNALHVPYTDRQQGLCSRALKQCVAGVWQNNYASIVGYNTQELCDFVDHDCDGSPITSTNDANLVTTLSDCAIGGAVGWYSAEVPGNVYIDYNPTGTNANKQKRPQTLNDFDRFFLNALIDTEGVCGGQGEPVCDMQLDDNNKIWFCRNSNVYYTQYQTGPVRKFSPSENLQEVVATVPGTITC